MQLNVRITKADRDALDRLAKRRGSTISDIVQSEAVFGRIEEACGAAHAATCRMVYGAVLQRLAELAGKQKLTPSERAEIDVLKDWRLFAFEPLRGYEEATPQAYARAAARLTERVPESALPIIQDSLKAMKPITAADFKREFFGG